MGKVGSDNIKSISSNCSIIKEIFDKYATDTITDDQVNRVLEPVLNMIREGRFDRNKRLYLLKTLSPILSVAAAFILILTIVFTKNKAATDKTIISSPEVPLAGISDSSNLLAGRVIISGKGLGDISLQLCSIDNQMVDSTITDTEGTFIFSAFSNGVYRLKILLPEDMELLDRDSEGYITIDGKNEFEFSNSNTILEGLEIKVWKKN